MILVILLTKIIFFFLSLLARKQCSKCCPRLCNQTTSTSEINDKEYDNRIGWTNSIKGQRTLFACRKVWHFLCTWQRIKFYIVVQVSQPFIWIWRMFNYVWMIFNLFSCGNGLNNLQYYFLWNKIPSMSASPNNTFIINFGYLKLPLIEIPKLLFIMCCD